MPQSYAIINPQPWAENGSENKAPIRAPLEMSRIPCLHATNPPQPATLYIHQSPIIYIDLSLEIPEPGECNESTLRVEGDKVVRIGWKLNDRVAALVKDGSFGGHETITDRKFL